jgi:hypothetical protein
MQEISEIQKWLLEFIQKCFREKILGSPEGNQQIIDFLITEVLHFSGT